MKKLITMLSFTLLLSGFFSSPIKADTNDNEPMPCDDMTCLTGAYEVKNVSSAYTTYGPEHYGTGGNSSTLSLNISFETSNSYTGSLGVSKGTLSAKVGYTIGKKYTVTASGTKNNPKGHYYKGYYKEIRETKTVTQDKQYVYGACRGWANINKKVYPYHVTGAYVYWK